MSSSIRSRRRMTRASFTDLSERTIYNYNYNYGYRMTADERAQSSRNVPYELQ